MLLRTSILDVLIPGLEAPVWRWELLIFHLEVIFRPHCKQAAWSNSHLISITGDLKKNAFLGVCHKILPLPSLGNLLGNFKEPSPVFGTLSQNWMLSMNLNLPGRCHFCATSSLRRASRQRHESGNFYFQIFVLIVILSALRLRRRENIYFSLLPPS